MEQNLIDLINHIQQVKNELRTKYQPELIEDIHELTAPTSQGVSRSKEYEHLMRQQRHIIYRNDYGAQQRAQSLMETPFSPVNTSLNEAIDDDLNLRIASKKSTRDDTVNELQKPWHKLPANLKIQAILTFIDHLVPHLTDDQANQLRYLLISAVSQKKITKVADVTYDEKKGELLKIHKLVFDSQSKQFAIADADVGHEAIHLQSFEQKKKMTQ